MQPQSEDLVFSNIKGESIPFAIGDSSVIIDIIRKRIYSHPIRTLVGEYLSNGRDACIEANKECHIDVILPTLLQPEFVVRDYGIGMSDERVREVFVRYGISTKRESKSQLGYFGIGAKSGWAYSDSFIVESYYDGVHREYIADIGENKEGRLLLFKETPTEEENGVRVRIPVNPSDVNVFVDAYRRATFLWEVKPSLLLGSRIIYPDLYLDLGSVRLFKTVYDFGCTLVLDANGIPFNIVDEHLMRLCRNKKLILSIKADPAKLNISANREGFSNTEYSTKLISKAKDALSTHIDKEFENAPFSEHRRIYSEMSFLRDFRSVVNKPYSFTEHNFYINGRGYFFIVQYRKPTEKCIIREYKFNSIVEIFLCRSKTHETLTPETKKALKVAKSECVKDSRTLLFFQHGLTDDEYKEIAEVIGATSYLEDVYASKVPAKVAKTIIIKQPKETYVRPFYLKHIYSRKVTLGPSTPLTKYLDRSVVFYGDSCPLDLHEFLWGIRGLFSFGLELISATSQQITRIMDLNDPRFVPIDNWKTAIDSRPIVLSRMHDAYAVKRHAGLCRILKNFGDKLSIPTFDLKELKNRIHIAENYDVKIVESFYKKEFNPTDMELDLLAHKYPLLTHLPDPSYNRDRNRYLEHINIYLRGVSKNA